jgi:CRP-like cAMP-binding protein
MSCPKTLDPVCVAILLRLSEQSMNCEQIARELQVDPSLVGQRLRKLAALGAINQQNDRAAIKVHPDAFRIILETSGSRPGVTRDGSTFRAKATVENRLSRLQRDPMFQSLPVAELEWLSCVSRTQEYSAGEILLLEGGVCQGLYIVDEGMIRLSKASTSCAVGFGREQTIRFMGPGESFNEVPVFDDGPNPVTAEAIEPSRVILVPKQEVQDLVQRSPEFAGFIIKIMSQRLRHMVAMIEDVSMRDVTGRVAKILLQMTRPSEGVGAGLVQGRKITQREIAEMAGTAREVVARALKKLERAGAISVHRGDVKILNGELLESLT